MPSRPTRLLVTGLAALALFVLSVLPFVRTVSYGIVNYDDIGYVSCAADSEINVFSDVSQAIWMPLTWLSYRLDYFLAGADLSSSADCVERAYHLMHVHSVAVHGINAVLVFVLLLILFRRQVGLAPCLIAALLWAVHPLRCESVCWIASRKDVCSMLWLLTGVICWVLRRSNRPRQYCLGYVASLVSFCVSACYKPSAMLFTPIVFLLDWLVLDRMDPFLDIRRLYGRLAGGLDRISPSELRDLMALVRRYLPYVLPCIMTVSLAFFSAWAQKQGGAMEAYGNLPLHARLVNAIAALGLYVKNTFVPFDLAPLAHYWWPALPRFFWFGLVLDVLVVVAFVFLVKPILRPGQNVASSSGRRYALAGLLWFCICLFPFIGIVSFGAEPHADRFTYIPSVGFSLVAMAFFIGIVRRGPCVRKWTLVIGSAFVAALSVIAMRQSAFWRNDEVLFAHTLEVDGHRNTDAWASLGLWYFEFPHDLVRAVDCFRAALECKEHRTGRIYQYHLVALCELGRMDEAAGVYGDFASWDVQRIREINAENGSSNSNTTGFLAGRLVYLFCRPETREAARAEMRQLVERYGRDPYVLYASYLMGISPREALKALPESSYFRYRYLEKGIDCRLSDAEQVMPPSGANP